jgi:WD40 repeat protein
MKKVWLIVVIVLLAVLLVGLVLYRNHLLPEEPDATSGSAPCRTLAGHSGWIHSLAFSPAGTLLASGSYDQTVKLWDVANGTESVTLRGHSDNVYGVAFSPDGQLLASGSWDGTVKLWNISQRREEKIASPVPSVPITSVAFTGNGDYLVIGAYLNGNGVILVWDLKKKTGWRTLKTYPHTSIVALASPVGEPQLLAATDDGEGTRWNAKKWEEEKIFSMPGNASYHIAFSPDGSRAALAWINPPRDFVTLLRLERGADRQDIDFSSEQIRGLAFSSDGERLAIVSGLGMKEPSNLDLLDLPTKEVLLHLKAHSDLSTCVAYSPNGTVIATAGTIRPVINLWRVPR